MDSMGTSKWHDDASIYSLRILMYDAVNFLTNVWPSSYLIFLRKYKNTYVMLKEHLMINQVTIK